MAGQGRDHALDHVVVVVFENRSLDNVLGRLYGPGDGKTFDGVIGKDLTNPIPEWAEHGADRKVVPYTVATDMDSPNPDTGEEHQHTNTQLYNILNEQNRFKTAGEMTAPYNAPAPGQVPTMDGFVTDYISTLTVELGRQPTYEEYSQVMTGFTPEQLPVLSGLARGFGVFDHWFCEVPSQTFTNRSFWTAATALGFVVNEPVPNWLAHNTAETIFNRLEEHGKTTGYARTRSTTTSRSRDCPPTPTLRSPPSRHCTSSITSLPSNSPCCTRRPESRRRNLTPRRARVGAFSGGLGRARMNHMATLCLQAG